MNKIRENVYKCTKQIIIIIARRRRRENKVHIAVNCALDTFYDKGRLLFSFLVLLFYFFSAHFLDIYKKRIKVVHNERKAPIYMGWESEKNNIK